MGNGSRLMNRLEELLAELDRRAFRLPGETIEEYKKMLESARELLEAERSRQKTDGVEAEVIDEAPSDPMGEELDQRILELFPVFLQALVRGKESTAQSDLKAILDGIRYTRRPIAQEDPERAGMQAEGRLRAMERLVVIAQLQDHLDELEEQIRELENNQLRLDGERDYAGNALTAMQQEKPYLKNEVELYRERGMIIGNDFLQYVQTVNRFLRSGNLSRKNALVLERQRESYAKIETVLQQVNLIAFGTPQLLGNVELDRLRAIAGEFQKELAREQQQAEELKQLSERVDETIEAYGERAQRENLRKIRDSADSLQEWMAMKKRESVQYAEHRN